jgi:ribonuclease T1
MLCNAWARWLKGCAGLAFAGLLGLGGVGLVQARDLPDQPPGTVSQSQLPPQALDMMALIFHGGPFRYDKDGSVFGNRERILPARSRGYYREYTVRTPTDHSRGARRIICGGLKPAMPEACYYTDDHYASFRRIVQ